MPATRRPTRLTTAAAAAWGLGAGDLALGGLGVLALLAAALGAPPLVTLAFVVVLSGLVALAVRVQVVASSAGLGGLGRLLVLAAVVVTVLPAGPVRWLPAVVLVAATVAEVAYASLVRVGVPFGAQLPGLTVRQAARVRPGPLAYGGAAALLLVGAFVLLPLPAWPAGVVAGIALVGDLVALADVVAWVRDRRRAERRLPGTLTAYGPRFALHWDAPPGTAYQIGRWIPYLDRLGERYVLLVRNPASFAEALALTDQPVLLRRGSRELDAAMVPTLRAVFYVNNALQNVHAVRYPGLRHVQLFHGESDKAASYNPVFRMFDKNFVAGQAAIDRFAAHGLATAPGFFEIVGRPQIEDVAVGEPEAPVRRVLYAPTWAGAHADSAYSSLPVGPQVVRALLDRGVAVVYRPHPYTDRNAELRAASSTLRAMLAQHRDATGTPHVFGPEAEHAWSVVDCFNAVDALVSDVSSVVPDFLYSEKPFALVAMNGSAEEFVAATPIAAGGYVVTRDLAGLEASLDLLLGPDPRRAERHRLKVYYLGDFSPDSYADGFLEAARREIA